MCFVSAPSRRTIPKINLERIGITGPALSFSAVEGNYYVEQQFCVALPQRFLLVPESLTFLQPNRAEQLLSHPWSKVLKTWIFETNNPGFHESFDEKPFEFKHTLTSSHPLFSRSRLRRLLLSSATKDSVYYNAGEIRIDQRWDAVPPRTKSVEEIFDSVDVAGAWILLRRVNEDPEYNLLLEDCLSEVKRLSGRAIDEDKKSQEADIYITSPGRVTMYHVDPICNFLMQIGGEKQIHVFDRNDRDVMPEEELERFWVAHDHTVKYRRELESRAEVFTLRPGTGVHVPVTSPHWLKNGNNISISLSINYHYKDARRKNVYQANYYLRKMGLKPKPLGSSKFVDSIKSSAMTVSRMVKMKFEGLKSQRNL